jgi:hypothetical protein
MAKWIWSDSQGAMVLKRFEYDGAEYEWDDVDEVYYDVLSDENFLQEVPAEVMKEVAG